MSFNPWGPRDMWRGVCFKSIISPSKPKAVTPPPPEPPPAPPPPAPIEDPEDEVLRKRQRRKAAASVQTGRLSTILSDSAGDTFG